MNRHDAPHGALVLNDGVVKERGAQFVSRSPGMCLRMSARHFQAVQGK